MSSQDLLSAAQSEEEKAKVLQHEIEKEQANITSMQSAMRSEDQADINALQVDVDSKNQIIASLQQKQQTHSAEAERLQQEAAVKQQQEQQEQQRKQQEGEDGSVEQTAKDAIGRALF